MLEHFEALQFRCFEHVALELNGGSAGLVGPNASGKTSLLEGLYVLAYGRSFRSSDRRQLLRVGGSSLRLEAEISDPLGSAKLVSRGEPQALQFSINARQVGVTEVATRFPVHLIDPSVHRFIEGSPQERRRLLDTGVFHVEPTYLAEWRQFRRVLRQRNAALKSGYPRRDAPIWDLQFSSVAARVDTTRREYVRSWSVAFQEVAESLGLLDASLEYRRGWPESSKLDRVLDEGIDHDVSMGSTQAGPQRADVRISLGGRPARRVASRGQQKLLASALVLSQLKLMKQPSHEAILLIDDPGAELDVDNLGKFLGLIAGLPMQMIVTTTFPAALEALPRLQMFHVKQAGVERML
jgi:DNA replication and repair protein RecF